MRSFLYRQCLFYDTRRTLSITREVFINSTLRVWNPYWWYLSEKTPSIISGSFATRYWNIWRGGFVKASSQWITSWADKNGEYRLIQRISMLFYRTWMLRVINVDVFANIIPSNRVNVYRTPDFAQMEFGNSPGQRSKSSLH